MAKSGAKAMLKFEAADAIFFGERSIKDTYTYLDIDMFVTFVIFGMFVIYVCYVCIVLHCIVLYCIVLYCNVV